ncbi:hypothetical protein [Quisquiliibacterium transsilvanicum]|uniref:Uncharacterized protein n=1 Tax=Quisquiliibacterium transsilvanicum TaxID=1549638 RepID=A0A7W8HG46_9BURK|nr:hypothetical protein [Quisquiliibacterium transsilvanicum]MBB5271370.1 hypothetical protein [Quisquiliibacterium transsilvanicum]
MQANELREHADMLLSAIPLVPPSHRGSLTAAADYLRACADALDAEPVAWVRFRSDGGYEGPLMDSDKNMSGARRLSGVWTKLYPVATPALRLPEPMTEAAVFDAMDRHKFSAYDLARAIEAETMRRAKECNAAPTPPVQQDDEALEVLKLAFDALTCGDTGDDLEDSHRCGKCDEYVDRNAPVRQRIRALIAKRGEK